MRVEEREEDRKDGNDGTLGKQPRDHGAARSYTTFNRSNSKHPVLHAAESKEDAPSLSLRERL
jgi:hypothetical protein